MRNYWIVLDTSVVRGIVDRDVGVGIDLAELARLRGLAPVSLSESAMVELTGQLLRRDVKLRDWHPVARELDSIMDREYPIVPLGAGLRTLLKGEDDAGLANGLRSFRAVWHLLKTARLRRDLANGRCYTFDGKPRSFQPAAIRARLDETEQRWAGSFEEMVRALGRPVIPADRAHLVDALREIIGVDDVKQVPELETPIQLAIEWLIQHGRQYEKGLGYKPKRNDALDFEQLYVLGLPGILCTSDGPFINRVRSLHTPGSDRVLRPAELLAQLRANE